MGMTDILKSYLESTIKMIVDKPEEVNVDISTSTKTILVQIKSAKTDIGKIVGRKGKTIESLKIISAAIKNTKFLDDSRNVVLEILEDENSSFKSFKN
jgi:uncharacterized protein